ncbi:hypothetical protein TNCV_3811781 [Trichonephila clavipes]|nr:hypothetical protein TNCV_3811781 [Trichonephila clavipes]
MLRLGKTRPLPGHSSIESISTRKNLRSGVPPPTTESNKRGSVPVIWQKTRNGAYLEYTQNIMLQHQGEDPTDDHFESRLKEFDPVFENREPENLQDENTDTNGALGGHNPSGLILVFSSRENLPKDLVRVRESTADEFGAMWKIVLTC